MRTFHAEMTGLTPLSNYLGYYFYKDIRTTSLKTISLIVDRYSLFETLFESNRQTRMSVLRWYNYLFALRSVSDKSD